MIDSKITKNSKITKSYDIVVCGLGISSCLLLRELNRSGLLSNQSVVIIEPNLKHKSKTLSFWADPSEALVTDNIDVIEHSWTNVEVPPAPVEKIEPYHYFQIRSQVVFDDVIKLCEYNSIDIIQERVEDVFRDEDQIVVTTSGCVVMAEKVFDGVHVQPSLKDSTPENKLLQSFYGQFIELPVDYFEDDTLTLMDFEIPQDGATQFMYVLPKSYNCALVECTRFGTEKVDIDLAREHIQNYILKKWGSFTVLDDEQGVIPMSFVSSKPLIDGVVQIGTNGGAVKPSTGYAFRTMFHHAQQICNDFSNDVHLKSSSRFRFYDSLLIDILIHKPELGKSIFVRLFKTQKILQVFKFLQENTSIWEEVKIFAGLKWRPFLAAALRVFANKFRCKTELRLLVITMAITIICLNVPSLTIGFVGFVLGAGMLIIGIPHGALDHRTFGESGVSRWDLNFHIVYWGLIGFMGLLWVLSPVAGLMAFVLSSAWHFGQTDFQHWSIKAKTSVATLLWGGSVLTSIIGTHPLESVQVLEMLSIPTSNDTLLLLPILGFAALTVQLCMSIIGKSFAMFFSMCTLALSAALPLPLAFGLYFVGQHSVQAWSHLKNRIESTHRELWIEALPFSIGALFLLGFFMFTNVFQFQIQWLIVVGSCITFPHIICMDSFYRKQNMNLESTTLFKKYQTTQKSSFHQLLKRELEP